VVTTVLLNDIAALRDEIVDHSGDPLDKEVDKSEAKD